MKRKAWKIALALLVVIDVTALATFAYNRWRRAPAPDAASPAGVPEGCGALCLDGRQAKCVFALRARFEAETGDLRSRIRDDRRRIVEELKKDAPDAAALDRLVAGIGASQTEIQKKAVRNLLREKDLLTEGQKRTFCRLFEDYVCPREAAAGKAPATAWRSPRGPEAPGR